MQVMKRLHPRNQPCRYRRAERHRKLVPLNDVAPMNTHYLAPDKIRSVKDHAIQAINLRGTFLIVA